MAIEIVGDLSANSVLIDEQFVKSTKHGKLFLNGTGITVSIQTIRAGHSFNAELDSNSSFSMAPHSFVNLLDVNLKGGSAAAIGENTFAIGKLRLYSHEHAALRIGRDCIIGGDVLCMTSDMHSILDVTDGTRINPPGNIDVGDHVWLGAEAILLKNTQIGNGSIVGIRSVVMGTFPANCLVLGYPARLVKSGVTWSTDLRPVNTNP